MFFPRFLSLQVVVEATDQATPISDRLSVRKTIIISIVDINDNSPEFVSPPAGAVLENSESGTEVMTVSARDKDAGRNAEVRLHFICAMQTTAEMG